MWRPDLGRWGRPLAFALTVVIAVIGMGMFVVAGTQVGWTRVPFDDFLIYRDSTARVFSGEAWYLARQISGPYEILHGDVLYPPVTAWFFIPWLLLPAWTFAAAPIVIIGWFVLKCRPAPWAWPVIALGVTFPLTLVFIAYGNPSIWVAAFVALGLRYRWPGVLVLLKPSLLPFALVGIHSRGWWLGLAVLGLATLPFLTPTLEYPAVLLDARGGGILYSLTSVPILLVPVAAWLGRTRGRG